MTRGRRQGSGRVETGEEADKVMARNLPTRILGERRYGMKKKAWEARGSESKRKNDTKSGNGE